MSGHCGISLRLAFLAGLVLLASVAPKGARADNFYYSGNAQFRTEYNTNRRLNEDDEESLGLILDLQLDLIHRTERSQATLTPRLRFERWLGDRAFDTDDQHLTGSYSLSGERWQVAADGSYIRDTTLTSDFDVIDSARVTERRRRERRSGNLSGRYLLTEKTSVGASAGVSDTS
ncbi:MAG: hypothetical protein AAF493_14470, partial [Pseudomonadota bacterium]